MAIEDYSIAKRMAQKAARSAVSNGSYPYLPALDEFVPRDEICGEQPLGIVDIPLDMVAGTKTSARKNSFANNFMPLLDEDTEFAVKWSNLYEAQMNEGIRDPILAYEYMTRYYVQEGNKRVSVLKYVKAASITANVIRLLPKKTDDLENRIYYEYMDFYEASKICMIDFSTEGAYEELCSFYGKAWKQPWEEDERQQLRSDFSRFEQLFSEKGGEHLKVTAGDAFLVYLRVYGRKELPFRSNDDLKNEIDRIWREFMTQVQDQSVKLLLEPTEQPSVPLIKRISFLNGTSNRTLKVGFIYGKTPKTSAWTYAHELGRLYLEEVFGDQIQTKSYYHAEYQFSPMDVLEQAISDGNQIIFTTIPYLSAASLKAAVAHPEVKILNCSTNSTYNSIRTYYCRMYETKFLLGLIAGSLAGEERIGYIADYPIFSTISNINAFALGAKMVNTRAKIQLTWSSLKGDVQPVERLDAGIRYISDKDFIVPEHPSRRFGLYERDGEKLTSIATTVCHWGKFYEQIIQGIRNDTWKTDTNANKNRAINYWWGMSAGVTELICSGKLPAETRRLVSLMTELIKKGQFKPFDTELIDNEGTLRQENGAHMSHKEIVKMDWLLDNVEGKVPSFSELKDEALPLVLLQGDVAQNEES
ncbi:MAG: BMP family ABC transporter substrate-binding protein [Lachnospiraceae bacterium]|nr:BMP family ABC transporter substrate-binding protein [Lachnospiraceae bacterium]